MDLHRHDTDMETLPERGLVIRRDFHVLAIDPFLTVPTKPVIPTNSGLPGPVPSFREKWSIVGEVFLQ